MALEKLVPRLMSFLPTGLYFNSKKDAKKIIKEKDKTISGKLLNETSNMSGIVYELLRDSISIVAGLYSVEAGLITYGVSSYILDKASNSGFLLMN